jgi:hypothetical protein
MLDEQRVHRDPVARVDGRGEGSLGLLRGSGPHDPQSIGDPVDVGVDRDRGDPVAEHQDAVRRLRTDTLERGQRREVRRNDATEPVEHRAGDVPHDTGLRPIEAGRPDEPFDVRGRGRREGRRVRVPGEQLGARDVRRLVPRPLGEDGPDENLEGVLGVVPQVWGPPVPRPVERGEAVEEGFPVEWGTVHASVRPVRAGTAALDGAGSTPGSDRSGSSDDPFGRRSSPIK